MNALPVIVRELRTEARHPLNYWLRVASAAVMLGVAVLCHVGLDGTIAGRGNVFFGVLQPTLFSLIWLLGPIMTCDSISKERREGTLGLLFLTPLRPVDVGIAKALSGVLRAFTLILAALPVVAIPLLVGGVSGADVLRAALMDVMALFGAISAGLYASSRCREFSRAALLSLLLGGIALILLGAPQTFYFLHQALSGAIPGATMPDWSGLLYLTIGPWAICSGVGDAWQNSPAATSPTTLIFSVGQMLAAAGMLLLTLAALNRNLRRLSVETGMTQRQVWWWKTLCTPRIFTGLLAGSQRGMLNRNPIGWLQRRTWSARVATWGWLGALLVVETALVTSSLGYGPGWNDLMDAQPMIGLLLALGITFSAADSFRKERETGALELLLVTPLTARQIIAGRLYGLWGQYLPAFLLLLVTWYYTSSMRHWVDADELFAERHGLALIYLVSFTCLPIIGLNQSLHRRNFFAAWLGTIVNGLAIPILGPMLLLAAWRSSWGVLTGLHNVPLKLALLGFVLAVVVVQGVFARRAIRQACQNLNERRFVLAK